LIEEIYIKNPKSTNMKLLLVVARFSGMKSKDRVLVWRHVNESGFTSIIRSVFALTDGKEERLKAEILVELIEKKGGKAWLFISESHSGQDKHAIEKLIKMKMENEVNEFIEECNEFIDDISKELKEEEFEFYELEELSHDLIKLEKWKTKIIEKYTSTKNVYETLEGNLEKCRKLMKIFEKKCLGKKRI
jgi:DNA-binding transcriptional regulator PaaX